MSKNNLKKWAEIQKELNALYYEYDHNPRMTSEEYSARLNPLRARQDAIRDK